MDASVSSAICYENLLNLAASFDAFETYNVCVWGGLQGYFDTFSLIKAFCEVIMCPLEVTFCLHYTFVLVVSN